MEGPQWAVRRDRLIMLGRRAMGQRQVRIPST